MNKKYAQILYEDLQNRKEFTANWRATCSIDTAQIELGDTFYFMGNKQKVCLHCFEEIMQELELFLK